MALLKAGQGGSGGDLACFLVEVLGKSENACGTGEKGACKSVAGEAKKQTDQPAIGGLERILQGLQSADLQLECRQVVDTVEGVPVK